MNIIEGFGFEQCFEDENSIYYRAMIGFSKHNFFGHQYYTNSNNSTIMVFT